MIFLNYAINILCIAINVYLLINLIENFANIFNKNNKSNRIVYLSCIKKLLQPIQAPLTLHCQLFIEYIIVVLPHKEFIIALLYNKSFTTLVYRSCSYD